ncbi:hypothetical protein IQ07DRAFT_608935 [Pyrenochaeta sp. DS3sAY3a]|nr:hypothetical protein IQ07DRAFT_608935 [Pyrenochaeta sp. DS3sAY3a]
MGSCGILDEICPVFRTYNHPLILVGMVAHRWMGSRGFSDHTTIDVLLRNGQLHSITSDLVRTGHWEKCDVQELERLLENDETDLIPKDLELALLGEADVVLERTHHDRHQIYYMRFWSEETYRIKIDSCSLVEVPDVYAWNSYLMEEEYHPAIDRTDGWWFGPDIRPKPTDCILPTLPHGKPLGSSERIFIPSIPTFIQALWAQHVELADSKPQSASIAKWFIRNLTRYLYLEVSPKRHAIAFQLDNPYDVMMEEYELNYKRKPMVIAYAGHAIEVKVWDPSTYPPKILEQLPKHRMPEKSI